METTKSKALPQTTISSQQFGVPFVFFGPKLDRWVATVVAGDRYATLVVERTPDIETGELAYDWTVTTSPLGSSEAEDVEEGHSNLLRVAMIRATSAAETMLPRAAMIRLGLEARIPDTIEALERDLTRAVLDFPAPAEGYAWGPFNATINDEPVKIVATLLGRPKASPALGWAPSLWVLRTGESLSTEQMRDICALARATLCLYALPRVDEEVYEDARKRLFSACAHARLGLHYYVTEGLRGREIAAF